MPNPPKNSYDVLIGDDASTVAIGNGINQFRSETHIHFENKLDDYATTISNGNEPIVNFKTDWLTSVITIFFTIATFVSVLTPLMALKDTSATSNFQNWILPLASVMSGLTSLMGVLVGFRLSNYTKRL